MMATAPEGPCTRGSQQLLSQMSAWGGDMGVFLTSNIGNFKKTITPSQGGVVAAPKDASYHASIQIFQALGLRQVLHCDEGALGRLLGQPDLKRLLVREDLHASVEMVGLEGEDHQERLQQGGAGGAAEVLTWPPQLLQLVPLGPGGQQLPTEHREPPASHHPPKRSPTSLHTGGDCLVQ